MIRDPFYREIEARLGGRLDPEAFEQCAADLLRAVHPTLVPVRGGNDAGMDGAIADRGGLPIPLVTTTAQDVIGNLKRSLRSYVDKGGTRRLAVVATSRALTPQRRRNLEQAAKALGFTIVQVHDRSSFADLLYRDPKWCRELLDLTGALPPLSILPLPNRPLSGTELIGRSDDLDWIEKTAGDLLVVGQPGIGKTFLLHHFAKRGGGLFVHSSDPGEIVGGIRSQEPAALVVDDAHLQLGLLPQLRRLRTEMGAVFRIIADSWPGHQDEVRLALEVPSTSIRCLDLLSRDDIATVVRSTGIGGPSGLIQEIVNQAEGKAGLAITLANLCLRGDVTDLAKGDALAREIRTVFNRLVCEDATPFIAAFAVAGDAGMSMQDVASYLAMPIHQLRERASKLAAGGVLLEVGRERLSVRPPPLRHALVRDVFFGGAISLPIEPLISKAPDVDEITATIIGARFRGARVPAGLLQDLIERCASPEVWEGFARLGRPEVEWIRARHPQWLTRIGSGALDLAPEIGLPPLLRAAVSDNRALHSNPDHPLRVISDWVVSARPGSPVVLERRRALLAAAERWLDEKGDPAVGIHALALSLSPAFSRTDTVPGSGMTITFSQGYVSLKEAQAIRALWPRARVRVVDVDAAHWGPFKDTVESWAFRGAPVHSIPDDFLAVADAFAQEMVRDLVEIGKGHAGIIHWAHTVAGRLRMEVAVPLDPEYETLFPVRSRLEWREAEAAERNRAHLLAEEWAGTPPTTVVPRLLSHENEARLSGRSWPRWTPCVCQRIAESVEDPAQWLEALCSGGASSELARPFLWKILERGIDPSGLLARRCLADERYRLDAALTLLTSPCSPPDLIDLALGHLSGGTEWVETLCLRRELPEPVVARLLRHPDDEIAAAAAIGEWNADPKGEIRPSLRDAWRVAVLRGPADEWSLREILGRDPSLAVQWLTSRLKENRDLWRYEDEIRAAIAGLSADDRRHLLTILPDDLFPSTILRDLVGTDPALYRDLLQLDRLKALHLAPLIGHPSDPAWVPLAQAALDAGYSPTDIAEAVYGNGWSWSGSESAMWEEWVKRFEVLRTHPSDRVREIGAIGADIAAQRRERARERERVEQIRGR